MKTHRIPLWSASGRLHSPLARAAAALLAASACATAQVTVDFASNASPVVLRGDQPEGSAVEWSPDFGGSVKITAPSGYNAVANLNLNTNPAVRAELDLALLYGGTISYKAHVTPDALAGGNPNWFEALFIANSNGAWDPHVGTAGGHFAIDSWPLDETREIDVTIPIRMVESGGAVGNNGFMEYTSGSGWYELFIGINSGNNGDVPEGERHTFGSYHISEFTITANPAPPPSEDAVVIDFSEDTEGFGIMEGNETASIEWSELFGGSMKLTFDFESVGWHGAPVLLDMNSNPDLRAALDGALVGGGTMTFTIHVRQEDILGGNPGWFEGIVVANSTGGYNQHFGAGQGFFQTGGWPLSQPATYTVSMPIQPVGVGEGQDANSDGRLKYAAGSDFYHLRFGLNAQSQPMTQGGFYVSRIVLDPTPPALPPKSAAYTFDSDAEGFNTWGDLDETFTVSHSSELGGALRIPIPTGNWHWRTFKVVGSDSVSARLRAAAERGGTISFDFTGPVGTAGDRGILLGLQPQGGGWAWNQVEVATRVEDVRPLGNGMETARITYRVSSVTPGNDAGLPVVPVAAYRVSIGFVVPTESPIDVFIDNLTVTPYSEDRETLGFEEGPANFVATNGGFVFHDDTGELQRTLIINPGGWVWGARANFTADAADAQVASMHAKLSAAAEQGGILRFLASDAFISNRGEGFTGLGVNVALEGDPRQEVSPLWFPAAMFRDADGEPAEEIIKTEERPMTARMVEVNLLPADSTRTDGIRLPAGAASYSFLIGTNADDVDEANVYIDNFEVIVHGAPEIISVPTLPQGSSGIVGRVLGYGEGFGTFSATGLPPGVTIDPVTGLVSGTPTANGTYNVVFTLTTPAGADSSESFEWEVEGVVVGPASDLVVSDFGLQEEGFVLTWSGQGEQAVNILRSTNLGGWDIIATGVTTGVFVDENPPDGAAFYQVVIP